MSSSSNSFTLQEIEAMDSQGIRIPSLFSVHDKNVVVSGASRGIGLMIAHALISNGANVFAIARDKKVIEEVSQALTKLGPGKCFPIPSNLSAESECRKVAETVKTLSGGKGVHALINNAGANWGEAFDTYPDSAWDKLIALNVKTCFHLTRALAPQFEQVATASSPARVINIGSVDGIRVPALETYAYSASKAAVHQLTRVLAAQLASKQITVNAIAAGPFPSKMMKATLDKFHDTIVDSVPLKRIGGPKDIGGVILWLISDAGAWITGAIVPVEGGTLIKASL